MTLTTSCYLGATTAVYNMNRFIFRSCSTRTAKNKSEALDCNYCREISKIATLKMMIAKCKHFEENWNWKTCKTHHVQRHLELTFPSCLICEVLSAAATYGFPTATVRGEEKRHLDL